MQSQLLIKQFYGMGVVCMMLTQSVTVAQKFSDRVNAVMENHPTKTLAEQLFYYPQTELDQHLYATGAAYHWLRYSSSQSGPEAGVFRGYSLFADPYHVGLQRISFLLGSDCSHFVHRFFQLLGAEYPVFMKTRHFVQLARGSIPTDVPACRWKSFAERIHVIEASQVQAGDLFVVAHSTSLYGEHGHMGVILDRTPKAFRILHAKNSKQGLVEEWIEDLSAEGEGAYAGALYFFRYQGPLQQHQPSLEQALRAQYPVLNTLGCK